MRFGMQVLCTKGAKNPKTIHSGNRERVSWCIFINAAGQAQLPVFIIKGAQPDRASKMKEQMMEAWPEASYVITECATQTEDSWARCIAHFLRHAPGDGHVLFTDGHASRISIEAIDAMVKRDCDLMTLPPNSTHVTQPYDVALARPLGAALSKYAAQMQLGDAAAGVDGVEVTLTNVLLAFKAAFTEVTAPKFDPVTRHSCNTLSKGFEKTGLYPWNPSRIHSSWFAPAAAAEGREVGAVHIPTEEEKREAVEKNTVNLLRSEELKKRVADTAEKKKREHVVPGMTNLTGVEYLQGLSARQQQKRKKRPKASVRKLRWLRNPRKRRQPRPRRQLRLWRRPLRRPQRPLLRRGQRRAKAPRRRLPVAKRRPRWCQQPCSPPVGPERAVAGPRSMPDVRMRAILRAPATARVTSAPTPTTMTQTIKRN